MEKYIYHVTVTTGDTRKSSKSEVARDTLELLKGWVKQLLNGELVSITDERYCCRAEMRDSKFCEFVIARVSDDMTQTDLVRFTVCRHSRKKREAWALVGGTGDAPNVPFCAVQLYQNNIIFEDFEFLPVFGDFERCLAWAWLEYQDERKTT